MIALIEPDITVSLHTKKKPVDTALMAKSRSLSQTST